MMKRTHLSTLVVFATAALFLIPSTASAQVPLGTAQNFAALGGSTVTNTGSSVITGDVGLSPGSSVTGFPPGIVAGSIHAANAVAAQAQSDLTIAYNAALGLPCAVDLTGQDLGGLVLTPGVYCFSTSAQLTGTLTLDYQGDSNAFFLFKIGSTLTTASGSTVVATNPSTTTCPNNLFFQVGSSATLGTGTSFQGNILALASITLNTGTTLNGRALARNGAVTLDTNTVLACGRIGCPTILVGPNSLPPGTVGTPFNATVTASGGTGTYTFALTAGSLPAGLSLSSAGAITGTPTAPAAANFTITATDSNGCTGSRVFTNPVAFFSPGIPALDYAGMAVLLVLLAGVGLFVTSKLSS